MTSAIGNDLPEHFPTMILGAPGSGVPAAVKKNAGRVSTQAWDRQIGERDHWSVSGPFDRDRNRHGDVVRAVLNPGLEHPGIARDFGNLIDDVALLAGKAFLVGARRTAHQRDSG